MKTNKQVFKGTVYSRTRVKNNIKRVYDLSDIKDKEWYLKAHKFAIKISTNIDKQRLNKEQRLNIAIGLIASLSPLKRWNCNKTLALQASKGNIKGHAKQFLNKATLIYNSNGSENQIKSILNGNKITAFYENIKYYKNNNTITIDRHALSIAVGCWINESEYNCITDKQYSFFKDCYLYTSKELAITGLELQAITWVTFRKIKTSFKKGLRS